MIRQICKYIVFKMVYPCVYSVGKLRKINKKRILFVENHGEVLSEDYSLLQSELEAQGYEVYTHYLRISSSSWGSIVRRTIAMIWDMSTAACVFLNESNSVFGSFRVRKETRLIQLWHACGAFKKWGFSVADKSFGDDNHQLQKYSGHRNYDLVTVSGDEVRFAYIEAFGLQDNASVVKAIGVSRTDVFFSEERKQDAYRKWNQLQQRYNWISDKERKIILYAPTFRGDIRGAKSPDCIDLQMFSNLEEDYVIIIKQHPFVKEGFAIPENCAGFCMEVRDELSTSELLMLADICVTDYSSIIFEYSLMRKPMFFLACDIQDYYDERGFYYPYESFVPGPIVTTTKELVEQIGQIENYDMHRVEAFRDMYMNACDGNSTERILDYVLKDQA